MSYVNSVLQPGEKIRCITHLHWIIFVPGASFVVLSVIVFSVGMAQTEIRGLWYTLAALLFVFGLAAISKGWFQRATTEIAATNRRIILKKGFISLRTVEMQMDKVSTVDVTQTVMGRILGYGDVVVHSVGAVGSRGGGTDGDDGGDDGGLERFIRIESPIQFRNHVTGE
jgi:uncharacterized membrane protein YdbT with pleckstrin-like domain